MNWPLERVLFALAGTITLLSAALAAFDPDPGRLGVRR